MFITLENRIIKDARNVVIIPQEERELISNNKVKLQFYQYICIVKFKK